MKVFSLLPVQAWEYTALTCAGIGRHCSYLCRHRKTLFLHVQVWEDTVLTCAGMERHRSYLFRHRKTLFLPVTNTVSPS